VVEQVGRGDVTSGIETTGEIAVAQKLDLDVYKKISGIDLVNVGTMFCLPFMQVVRWWQSSHPE
jgi:hypothetical protein